MYTNHGDISLPLAVWLAADDGYDLIYDPNTYSATTLMAPIRSVILSRRMAADLKAGNQDIQDLVPSRVGTAVHTAAEVAWLYSRDRAFENLNIPKKIAERITINPDRDKPLADNAIPVYLEQRAKREIDGVWISGKFDFVYEGIVRDIKTTKVYNWIHGGNDKKYALQGSIYRWLNQDIITNAFCAIEFVFTDWSPLQAAINGKDYPSKRIMTRVMPLLTLDETEDYIRTQVAGLKKYIDAKQADMPECTPEELWMKPTKYAYYKNPQSTKKATKLFDTMREANQRCSTDGGQGRIVPRIAEPTFCKYCDARPICMQAAQFIEDGILQL